MKVRKIKNRSHDLNVCYICFFLTIGKTGGGGEIKKTTEVLCCFLTVRRINFVSFNFFQTLAGGVLILIYQ